MPVAFEAHHHAGVGPGTQRLGEHVGIEEEHRSDAEIHVASGAALAQRLPVLRLDTVAFAVEGRAELLESRPEVAARAGQPAVLCLRDDHRDRPPTTRQRDRLAGLGGAPLQ